MSYLLGKPVRYDEAPEQFCLGLYPEYDLDHLILKTQPNPVDQCFDSGAPNSEAPPPIRWCRPL